MSGGDTYMVKNIVFLIFVLSVVCLGRIEAARAESPAPELKSKGNPTELKEAMRFIAGISTVDFQTKINDKERADYYSVARFDKCLVKTVDEISTKDAKSGKTKVVYTETTIDLADIGKFSVADAEKAVVDNQHYQRVSLSCKAPNKCIKDEKDLGKGVHDTKVHDSFSFLVRNTASKGEVEKVFNKAISLCARSQD
jgi:hypothetical protein